MAKKAELIERALELKLEVTDKNTVAEIETMIAAVVDKDGNVEEVATEEVEIIEEDSEEGTFAKSGKRSAKAAREAKELAEKEERKQSGETDEPEVKKGPVPETRPRIDRRSKRYQEAHSKIEKGKKYSSDEALALVTETNKVKFDASVDVHIKLNVDPKQADQNIRGTVALPAGTGKKAIVAVLCDDDVAKSVKAAGADFAGSEVMKMIEKSELNFDVLIASPDQMPKLGKFAKDLGPKGLMPSPKSGTVSTDPEKAVEAAKAGQVEYRVDKQGIIHCSIGKVSFGPEKLAQNLGVIVKAINDARPGSIKGEYIQSAYLVSSMGPAVPVAL